MSEPRRRAPYAGLVTRGLALAADLALLQFGLALLAGLVGVIVSALSADVDANQAVVAAFAGVWIVIGALYFVTFWTLVGQTPGMRVMQIKVERPDGERLTIRKSLARLVGMLIAAIPLMLGYVLVLFDDRRRGLHDRIADTVVRTVEPTQRVRHRGTLLRSG